MDEEATFREGQITWMDPDHYQIHRLRNKSSAMCCTLQCYQYPNDIKTDVEPDGTFHYVNQNGTVSKFEPDSDMAYQEFRAKIKEEWIEHHRGLIIHPDQ